MKSILQEKIRDIKEKDLIPRHIAIIMDGNGRWAKKRNLPRVAGHKAGVKTVRMVVEECGNLGVEHLTLYTFSTENWKRPRTEVNALMKLLIQTLQKEIADLKNNNVKLTVFGDIQGLPRETAQSMLAGVEETAHCTGLNLNLALNYGGREEIVTAVRKIAEQAAVGEVAPSDVDTDFISGHLYTKDVPDPDLLIRTSGEMRISNFLLWQLAYTEFHITEVYWPDFSREDLYNAIAVFARRERRFGRVSEQLKQ